MVGTTAGRAWGHWGWSGSAVERYPGSVLEGIPPFVREIQTDEAIRTLVLEPWRPTARIVDGPAVRAWALSDAFGARAYWIAPREHVESTEDFCPVLVQPQLAASAGAIALMAADEMLGWGISEWNAEMRQRMERRDELNAKRESPITRAELVERLGYDPRERTVRR